MERCDSCEDLEQETTNPSMRDQPLCIRTSSKIKREKIDIEKEEFETTVSVIKTDLDPGDNDVEMKSYDDNKHNTSVLCSCVAASSRSLEQSSPPVLHENPFRDSVAAQMENGSIASREKYVVEINCLPQVAFLKILSYLSMKERLNASSVSKHWYNSCFDSSLWRKICLKGQKSVTDKVFCHLTHFSNSLIVLDISECGTISSDGLVKGLSQCLQLLELRIVRCYNCTDACLEEVGLTCKRLKLLDISLCSKVTDEGIQKMSVGCTKLEQLTMDQCRSLTSKSLFYVARNCPNLSVLSIEYNNHIEDDGVIALVQNCQFLKKIHLNSSGVTFRSVMCFASFCRNIAVLDVRNCKGLTDEVMFDLVSCCKSLEIMNLSLCFDVSDESISHIAKYCTKLRSLFLVHCKITDKGLKTFCKCNCDLERLDVSWCQEITGEGVRAIVEGCCTLTHLGLVRCDKVEEELVAELSQQYPHVFLSTFMTEMNRMFNKAGYSNGVQAILHPTSVES